MTITLSRGTTADGRILLPTGGPDGTASFVVAESEAGTSVSEVRPDGTYSLVGLGRAVYTVSVYHGPAQLPTIYLGSTYRRATSNALRVDAFGARLTLPAIDWRTPVFTDVASIRRFSFEIGWLLDEGVTSGYPDGSYRPLGSVNRDAMAAFLYRLAGRPAFTPPTTSPFTDVPTSSQFYKEVTWLAAEGISTGWPDHTFRPLLSVARDAMAAFMFRARDPFGWNCSPSQTASQTAPQRAHATPSRNAMAC